MSKQSKKQHRSPCHDCPWRRVALKGWLGSQSAKEWVRDAHAETVVDCHIHTNHQCAGLAIYRANVAKKPRTKEALVLPKDTEQVFGSAEEFRTYHEGEDQ